MWKRKELKSRARQVVKKNYWTAIVICFLIALLTGEFGTSILGIYQQEDSMNPYYIFMHKDEIADENTNNNNEQQLQQEQEIITKMEEKKESLSDIELKIWNAIEANLDSITKSQKYVFKISDAIKYFNLNEMTSGIVLSIMAIISIAFTIIIANPLIVAGKRYFIKAREKSSTKISVIGEIFKNKNWINGLMYLNYTLYEKSGLNLRNNIMHGNLINTDLTIPLIVSFSGLIFTSWMLNEHK